MGVKQKTKSLKSRNAELSNTFFQLEVLNGKNSNIVTDLPRFTSKVREAGYETLKPEELQTLIYTIGKENGYANNLRDWFKLIYEVVFGDVNGPRMGFFISFFGVKETKQLINDKIK